MIVDDQLLRQALGVVGNGAVVLEDDLDLAAGDRVAVLLHIKSHGGVDLLAGRGLAAGHRKNKADLHGLLGRGAAGEGHGGNGQKARENPFHHLTILPLCS